MLPLQKITQIAKKKWKFLAGCAIANQLLYPTVLCLGHNVDLNFPLRKIKIESEEKHLQRLHSSDRSLDARDYLNLSNSVVYMYKSEEDVCKDMADTTFDFYQKLIKANGRDDLEDKIRILYGSSKKSSHIWLEFQEKGVWVPYESFKSLGTPPLSLDTVKEYSKSTLKEKSNINIEVNVEYVSIAGTQIIYPTIDSFLLPGGFVRVIYNIGAEIINRF